VKDVWDRDLLLYFLTDTGLYANRQFGEVFGLSYSAVSGRAEFIELKIQKNKVIKGNTRQLSC
jgi:hypothetical protein